MQSPSHPLGAFRFCPVCGASEFPAIDAKGKQCRQCGFQYYFNPAAATVAVILDEQGRILAVRRARDPARGTLDLPGGFCDPGETAEEGVAREVWEETGLRVTSCRYLFSLPNVYPYSGFDVHTMDMFFECRVEPGGEARAMDDAASAEWVDLREVQPSAFGLKSVAEGVARLKKLWVAED